MTEISQTGEAMAGQSPEPTEPTELEVAQDVEKLDQLFEDVTAQLHKCADHVSAGRLDGNVVMLKMHELAAKLMGQG